MLVRQLIASQIELAHLQVLIDHKERSLRASQAEIARLQKIIAEKDREAKTWRAEGAEKVRQLKHSELRQRSRQKRLREKDGQLLEDANLHVHGDVIPGGVVMDLQKVAKRARD